MSELALLIDNDVVIKLSQMDSYADGLAAIGVTAQQVGSLGTMLRFMGLKSEARRLKLTRSQEEADRLHRALQSIVEVEPTPAEQLLSTQLMRKILEAELDIDEGELALMAIAVERSKPDVATSDKRALRSLPQLAELEPKVNALRRRLICFEQIFRRLCELRGLPRVRAAVLSARHADTTITIAYDQLEPKGAAAFISGMELVIGDRLVGLAQGWLKKF